MNNLSTITTKGQITIPAPLRKRFNLKPSDRVVFVERKNQLFVRKVPSLTSLYGCLHNPKIKPLTTHKLNKIIDKHLFSDR